jgi:hypothetical protein
LNRTGGSAAARRCTALPVNSLQLLRRSPRGDNLFSRKQLQPKAGAGFAALQLPDLG